MNVYFQVAGSIFVLWATHDIVRSSFGNTAQKAPARLATCALWLSVGAGSLHWIWS